MIEQKLHTAAEALPQPETTFASILHTAHQKAPVKPAKPTGRRRAIALILALLLLGGCAAGAVKYTYWAGPIYEEFSEAVELAGTLNVQVPEQLGDSPFYDATTVHTSTQDVSQFLGRLFAPYKTIALQYRTDESRSDDLIYFQFGSTTNDLWRNTFPFTDDGVWCDEDLDPETYRSEAYNDLLVQSGVLNVRGSGSFLNKVIWIDEDLQVCFTLSSSDYSLEELMEFVKEIIDLNHPD